MSTRIEQVVKGHAGTAPGHGPFIALLLRVSEGAVLEASYETYPCPGANACAKALCALVSGKSLKEAGAIRHDNLVKIVGPLPKHRRISYGLALLALSDALAQIENKEQIGE